MANTKTTKDDTATAENTPASDAPPQEQKPEEAPPQEPPTDTKVPSEESGGQASTDDTVEVSDGVQSTGDVQGNPTVPAPVAEPVEIPLRAPVLVDTVQEARDLVKENPGTPVIVDPDKLGRGDVVVPGAGVTSTWRNEATEDGPSANQVLGDTPLVIHNVGTGV